MNTKEIFEASVSVMKGLLTPEGMTEAIGRVRGRNEDDVRLLLERERENINELVARAAAMDGSRQAVEGVRTELIDALVVRYLRNREIFLKTFPEGIEEVDPDPVSIWAAMMISPADNEPGRGR